jgi:hypothetical protein
MSELPKCELIDESSTSDKQPAPSTDPERASPTQDSPKNEATNAQSPVMDWNGPDDPDNPQNWSFASKVYHVTVPGLFGFAV